MLKFEITKHLKNPAICYNLNEITQLPPLSQQSKAKINIQVI